MYLFHMKRAILMMLAVGLCACSENVITIQDNNTWSLVQQTKGPELGYSPDSGVSILTVDGYAFKDLNRNGELDVYEDWRKSVEERAADLASQMTIEQICGLMLYSSAVTVDSVGFTSKVNKCLKEDFIRHMLVSAVKDARTAAMWSNKVQAYCEGASLGIPSNNSSDPRNYTNGKANTSAYNPEPDGEFDPDGSNNISKWPREIGLGATFDPELVGQFGKIAAAEYRAMGLTTALSPQIDITSEPRWRRFYGSFSESPELSRAMAQTYCDAFQTTAGAKNGWGNESVNCMVKHWPGGGSGEGGRDAHFGIGKYAVYPGGGFDLALIPFIDGAFNLKGKTKSASAVMPYYTISYNQDPSGENVANGFSGYIIRDLLRTKYGYEGVVCTDWGSVKDYEKVFKHKGKPWGMENATVAERRLRCFEVGVDQLGGVYDVAPNIEAYNLWVAKYGEESARERFELSARRLLTNIFNVGLFENPYVCPDKAEEIVGNKEFVAAGYEAQLKAVVMLKNHGKTLPAQEKLKVYQPLRKMGPALTHWQVEVPGYEEYPFSKELLEKYFEVTDNPQDADFALVSIKSPFGHWGYDHPKEGEEEGKYMPISLQWGPYTATHAREVSVAGGDPTEKTVNRSYRGRTEISFNESDMILVQKTKEIMGEKPVVVVVATDRPFVPTEIEPYSDALLLSFGVSNNALLDVISGRYEPSALLPCQLPADMRTVEEQCEDLPFDMTCYVDADGNTYDFAFGLNWSGVIRDERVEKFRR